MSRKRTGHRQSHQSLVRTMPTLGRNEMSEADVSKVIKRGDKSTILTRIMIFFLISSVYVIKNNNPIETRMRLGDRYPRVSCVSGPLASYTASLWAAKGHLPSALEDRGSVCFQDKGHASVLPIIKDLHSASSKCPSYNATHVRTGATWSSGVILWEPKLQKVEKEMLILWLLLLLWIIKALISDPSSVSC